MTCCVQEGAPLRTGRPVQACTCVRTGRPVQARTCVRTGRPVQACTCVRTGSPARSGTQEVRVSCPVQVRARGLRNVCSVRNKHEVRNGLCSGRARVQGTGSPVRECSCPNSGMMQHRGILECRPGATWTVQYCHVGAPVSASVEFGVQACRPGAAAGCSVFGALILKIMLRCRCCPHTEDLLPERCMCNRVGGGVLRGRGASSSLGD